MKAIRPLKSLIFYALLIAPVFSTFATEIQPAVIGISNKDVRKIPVGTTELGGVDTDKDGIDDAQELAIGTDPKNPDSDHDGFKDLLEISTDHNPLGNEPSFINKELAKRLAGRYILQVENGGRLWYVNPKDQRRYYVSSAANFQSLKKKLALPALPASFWPKSSVVAAKPAVPLAADPIASAAAAIRTGDRQMLEGLCATSTRHLAIYNYNYLDAQGRYAWANILSSAIATKQTDSEKTYEARLFVDFADKQIPLVFSTAKQPDGRWLITKLH